MPEDRSRFQQGRVMSAIINLLRSVEGGYITTTQLIEKVYQGDEPDYARRCIHCAIQKLQRFGYPVAAMRGRGSRGYRFIPSTDRRVYDLPPLKMQLTPGKLLPGPVRRRRRLPVPAQDQLERHGLGRGPVPPSRCN